MEKIIYFIIAVNLLLAFKLAWDWYAKNKKKRIINHFRSALIDGMLYLFFIYIFKLPWGVFFVAIFYRWILFDLIFNILNGDKWNHYGESSYLDRLMKKTGNWHIVIKITALIISLWLTLILTSI